MQLAKVSAVTLSQQEEGDSEDLQRGRANRTGFLGKMVS
jgi:hypothetical protein